MGFWLQWVTEPVRRWENGFKLGRPSVEYREPKKGNLGINKVKEKNQRIIRGKTS